MAPNYLSLSDELLVHVLSYLSPKTLLDTSLVCRRLYHLSSDSQLWRAAYFQDFVLPRALRLKPVARHRGGSSNSSSNSSNKHGAAAPAQDRHDDSGSRLGSGDTDDADVSGMGYALRTMVPLAEKGWLRRRWDDGSCATASSGGGVDWKARYKLRHNWSQGKCALEELDMSDPGLCDAEGVPQRSLVKISDGIAVTADAASGLRAWNLRSRQSIAQAALQLPGKDDAILGRITGGVGLQPVSLALDGRGVVDGCLDVVVGFASGGFGIWRLHLHEGKLNVQCLCTRQQAKAQPQAGRRPGAPAGDDGDDDDADDDSNDSNDEIVALAYSYPYLLTAASSAVMSLYTLEGKLPAAADGKSRSPIGTRPVSGSSHAELRMAATGSSAADTKLPSPHLITRLRSHMSRSPLALSIRQTAASTVASVAYTFTTLRGWAIGIQDLHIEAAGPDSPPSIASSRTAYTSSQPSSSSSSSSSLSLHASNPDDVSSSATQPATPTPTRPEGPITLCYNHPYLLAAMPDNTLILHLCTSTATSLSISHGVRLWGHTSGISDADVTDRGKAVSVSCKGDEIRVWELEGGVRKRNAVRGVGAVVAEERGRSIEVRPRAAFATEGEVAYRYVDGELDSVEDGRRNWVGFDDEMVIVLKEARNGRESLMVYDFT